MENHFTLYVYCKNVDKMCEAAVAAGVSFCELQNSGVFFSEISDIAIASPGVPSRSCCRFLRHRVNFSVLSAFKS